MAEAIRARIGCISAGANVVTGPHLAGFQAMVPPDIQMELDAVGIKTDPALAFQDYRGKLDEIIERTVALVEKHGWDGLIFRGAPPQALNPTMFERLQETLKIPVATALASGTAGLKALSARRILLMTPFEERLNVLIREILAKAGIEATSPPEFIQHYTQARNLKPDDVFDLAKRSLEGTGPVDAVYFQGAVLDAIEIIERVENELETTVVASNPTMLWFVLSQLGFKYSIPGVGKLLREWYPLAN